MSRVNGRVINYIKNMKIHKSRNSAVDMKL